MIGAMTGFYAATRWFHIDHPTWLGFCLVMGASMLVCGVLGFVIEIVAYRPLRNEAADYVADNGDRGVDAAGIGRAGEVDVWAVLPRRFRISCRGYSIIRIWCTSGSW